MGPAEATAPNCVPFGAVVFYGKLRSGKLPFVSYSMDVVNAAGITYRQLDYWASNGYVFPLREIHGSGQYREWSNGEVQIIMLAKDLIDAGFLAKAAFRIARQVQENGLRQIQVTPGVCLVWGGCAGE